MKKTLLTFLLAVAAASGAGAQSVTGSSGGQGYYTYIPYRSNDPFVFCTEGVPEHCWVPLVPMLGTYTVTNQYCFNAASAQLYTEVCPQAMGQGGWTGPGSGSTTPFIH